MANTTDSRVETLSEKVLHVIEEATAHEALDEIDDVVGDANEKEVIHALEEASEKLSNVAGQVAGHEALDEIDDIVGPENEKEVVKAMEGAAEALDKALHNSSAVKFVEELIHKTGKVEKAEAQAEDDPLGLEQVLEELDHLPDFPKDVKDAASHFVDEVMQETGEIEPGIGVDAVQIGLLAVKDFSSLLDARRQVSRFNGGQIALCVLHDGAHDWFSFG